MIRLQAATGAFRPETKARLLLAAVCIMLGTAGQASAQDAQAVFKPVPSTPVAEARPTAGCLTGTA